MRNPNNETAKNIISDLVKQSRRNKLFSMILFSIAIALLTAVVAQFFLSSHLITLLLMLAMFSLMLIILLNGNQYKNINPQAVVEHINCSFPEFEESSQLLFKQNGGSILQQLQTQKIEALLLQQPTRERLINSLEAVVFKPSLIVLAITVVIYFTSILFKHYQFLAPEVQMEPVGFGEKQSNQTPQLSDVSIVITPPQYTKLLPITTSTMDLKIVEGSNIHWSFNFSRKDVEYFMVDVEGEKSPIKSENDQFQISRTFSQTNLYRIVYKDNSEFHSVGQVYTIEVIRDKAPLIKIINPKQSLLEIPKDSEGSFELLVEIKDDYGISNTNIIASVASGSGESVKFRDEEFAFDETVVKNTGKMYKKHWKLTELKMEPGDEVYFKVIAEDNKQPLPQLTKSSSVIVRWLDEQLEEISAEGIRINFIPEYFRSQRQIIIETERLIADRDDLTQQKIDQVSRDLGYSQSDLKTKYGQYLGDEVGEGAGADLEREMGIETAGQQENHNEDEETEEVGHVHEEMQDDNDLSGRSELIARFAHNHGTTEIAPLSKQDPKSWMKMAVSEMWQAELHLMLSQPELALEYENNAYDYLMLATQAERIYVKRLGFEPPPVNEDTRLTGELKDIVSNSIAVEDRADEKSDKKLFQQVYSILSENQNQILDNRQQSLLKQLKNRILVLSESRPALIKQAATIERILTENTVLVADCKDCIHHLKKKLWQLMPQPISQPQLKQLVLSNKSSSGNEYQQKILALKSSKLIDGVKND